MEMHNPAHPGLLVAEIIGEHTITDIARHLRVTRATLSKLVNGRSAVSAQMALRLEDAFGVRADLWLRMQMQRDLWIASRKKRTKVARLNLNQAS